MLHVLYQGDVKPGEAVRSPNVQELKAYRVKTPGGKYVHVLTDLPKESVLALLTKDEKAEGK